MQGGGGEAGNPIRGREGSAHSAKVAARSLKLPLCLLRPPPSPSERDAAAAPGAAPGAAGGGGGRASRAAVLKPHGPLRTPGTPGPRRRPRSPQPDFTLSSPLPASSAGLCRGL